ncbi:MAG: RNA 2',3'-cyclic phosphodiesterase [Bacteroidales bacterium]|nr:RNA 2',3'-cyclic phosphodiesterase [Bacteroidales bacterium]
MQNTKRLFAAIKIHPSDEFLKIYNQIKSALRNERITWVNPATMHLTIKFFGETLTSQIPDIDKCLKQACSTIKTFGLEIKNTGMFGSRYEPRVIWFGIEDGNAMQTLFHEAGRQLKTIGIFPDRQNFVPHLTIGRIKEIKNKKNYQEVLDKYREHKSGRQTIHELILFESILHREGPVYIPVHTYQLI